MPSASAHFVTPVRPFVSSPVRRRRIFFPVSTCTRRESDLCSLSSLIGRRRRSYLTLDPGPRAAHPLAAKPSPGDSGRGNINRAVPPLQTPATRSRAALTPAPAAPSSPPRSRLHTCPPACLEPPTATRDQIRPDPPLKSNNPAAKASSAQERERIVSFFLVLSFCLFVHLHREGKARRTKNGTKERQFMARRRTRNPIRRQLVVSLAHEPRARLSFEEQPPREEREEHRRPPKPRIDPESHDTRPSAETVAVTTPASAPLPPYRPSPATHRTREPPQRT